VDTGRLWASGYGCRIWGDIWELCIAALGLGVRVRVQAGPATRDVQSRGQVRNWRFSQLILRPPRAKSSSSIRHFRSNGRRRAEV
jgi:hypothetical protein